MSKKKKKRNKTYTGIGSVSAKPVVTKIEAKNRSKLGQWWFDNKKIIKPIAITVGIIVAIVFIVFEIIRIFSGS